MKIYYKTIEKQNEDGSHKWLEFYVLKYPEFCCKLMRHYYDYWGDKDLEGDVISFGDTSPFLNFNLEIRFEESDNTNIFFCPWCGEKIKYIEKERVTRCVIE